MIHRLRLTHVLIASVLACGAGIAVGGCNVVLDNEPGRLRVTRSASLPTDQTGDPNADPNASCSPGHTSCQGVCVDDDDPNYGCGSCAPCRASHGTATCQNHACVMSACDPGYAECNGKGDDGCETDLSKATSCGGCSTACAGDSPVCAPAGDSFACSSGCPLTAPTRCDNTCVATATSVNHCGKCGAKCLDVDHADVACVLGECRFTCKASYHLCSNACVLDTDAKACGAACTVCPAAPNAVATCKVGACSFTCSAGFDDCNKTASDGCETNLGNDPLHCGACGHSCNGGTCTAGVCSPPPPDAGP